MILHCLMSNVFKMVFHLICPFVLIVSGKSGSCYFTLTRTITTWMLTDHQFESYTKSLQSKVTKQDRSSNNEKLFLSHQSEPGTWITREGTEGFLLPWHSSYKILHSLNPLCSVLVANTFSACLVELLEIWLSPNNSQCHFFPHCLSHLHVGTGE